MEYYRTEIKTGIMAIICIAILVSATFYVGGSKMWGTAYTLNVAFKSVGGLELDAPVQYAGLEVGMIKAIRIMTKEEKEKFPDCTILANIVIDKLAQIKEDSSIQIKTMGFMGLKYIDITPGSTGSKIVQPGSLIKGEISQDIDQIMDSVGEVIDEIKPTITDLNKLINDADEVIVVNKEDIHKIVTNLSVATEHLKQFAEDIKEHPWKLLIRTPEKKEKTPKKEKAKERKPFWSRTANE